MKIAFDLFCFLHEIHEASHQHRVDERSVGKRVSTMFEKKRKCVKLPFL